MLVLVCVYTIFLVTNLFIEKYTELSPLSSAINTFVFEPVALLLMFLLVLSISARVIFSLVMVSVLYVFFMLINVETIKILGTVFSPIDVRHSVQLIFAKEVLYSYWLEILIAMAAVMCLGTYLYLSKPHQKLAIIRPWALLVVTACGLLVAQQRQEISQYIKSHFNLRGQSVPQIFSENHGYLFSFCYQLLKRKTVDEPPNYSLETVLTAINQYKREPSISTDLPHVIVFFIEGFADPWSMGVKTSYDPIPNFRKFARSGLSGTSISPELGGRSANPEFELLTGLSMRYVQDGSIPYIDHINRPYPSIARELKRHGYETSAIHVASLDFFNYRKAYGFLGFDQVWTLHQRQGVEKDVIGRFPSDQALVDEIIQTTTNANKPQFIFSFPNSTHGLWDYKYYLDSDLDVYGDFIGNGKEHLKTYVNALHTTDKAIGKLVTHYQNNNIPAVILVMGDHQPGLPEFRQEMSIRLLNKIEPGLVFKNRVQLRRAIRRKGLESDGEFYQLNHQVPFFIWSQNTDQANQIETSMNYMSHWLLTELNLSRSPLYSLLEALHSDYPELGKKTDIKGPQRQTLSDYQLLQYDIMFGENHYLRLVQ